MARPRAAVTTDPIDPCAFLRDVAEPEDGAVLLFLGVVRNHNEGREVSHLDYEAYVPMAESILATIVEEAEAKWETGAIHVVHRYGRLEIGETSVAIAVAAPHRGDAYAASRYVIEELKKRAPIWKQEGYVTGETEWLGVDSPERMNAE